MDANQTSLPPEIRILIAHEVRVLREGLASLLSRWPGLAIVEMVAETEGRHFQGIASSVDLVLLDAGDYSESLPDRIQKARDQYGDTKVVVIGVAETESQILECIEAGASAYTPVNGSCQDLVDTLRRVHQGEVICPPKISAILFERLAFLKRQVRPAPDHLLYTLTQREMEILRLISEGLSNKEIAGQLSLELQTVKNYVHNILEKLRVQNRREAARYVQNCPLPQAASS